MADITLTEEQLAKLAKVGETIRDHGVPAAEKMLNEMKAEFKLPPELKTKAATCNTCGYCAVCGPTPAAWVGVDMVVNVIGW